MLPFFSSVYKGYLNIFYSTHMPQLPKFVYAMVFCLHSEILTKTIELCNQMVKMELQVYEILSFFSLPYLYDQSDHLSVNPKLQRTLSFCKRQLDILDF